MYNLNVFDFLQSEFKIILDCFMLEEKLLKNRT